MNPVDGPAQLIGAVAHGDNVVPAPGEKVVQRGQRTAAEVDAELHHGRNGKRVHVRRRPGGRDLNVLTGSPQRAVRRMAPPRKRFEDQGPRRHEHRLP